MRLSKRWIAVLFAPFAVMGLTSVKAPEAIETDAPRTVIAGPGTVERHIKAPGVVQLSHTVEVGAQVSGQITKLYKREGDMVTQGEIIAEIENRLAQTGVDRASYTVENLKASKLASQASLVLYEQRAKRYRGLLEKDAIAREDVESAEATYQAAKASMVALEAQIRQAEAMINSAELQLGYMTIRSPIGGMVVELYAREGETLSAGLTTPRILRVADLSKMTVSAQVGETDVSLLRLSQTAQLSIVADPDRVWEGKIRQIMPVGKLINGGVYYETLFDVINDGSLRSQMTAEATFICTIEADVRVPLKALRKIKGNRAELQVMKNGSVETRQVKLLRVGEEYAAIRSGLKAGEQVVIPKEAATPEASVALAKEPKQ